MVALGLQQLGPEKFRAKLGYIPGLPIEADARAITARLLTTVYQAAANSGPVTRQAASAKRRVNKASLRFASTA